MENQHSKYIRESREFYRSIDICPRCGKNELFGDERNCPECRAKSSEYERKRYEKDSTRLKQKNASFNRLYHERKASGICVKCKKRKADENHVTCTWCRKKENAKQVERRKRKLDNVGETKNMKDMRTTNPKIVKGNEQRRLFMYVDNPKSKDEKYKKNYENFKRPVTNYGSVKHG